MNDLISKIIRCPLTGKIFFYPVTLEDGITYEKSALKELLKVRKISPETLEKNSSIMKLVTVYLFQNPDKKSEQYEPKFDWSLYEYKKLTTGSEKKEYLDSHINSERQTSDNWRPVHFICEHDEPEMIRYVIDKCDELDIDLECETDNKWRPIHFICRYSTFEMIKYSLQKCNNSGKCFEYQRDKTTIKYTIYDLIKLNDKLSDAEKQYFLRENMFSSLFDFIGL